MLRCSSKACRVYRSIQSTNPFFFYEDKLGRARVKLSLAKIIELTNCFLFATEVTLTELQAMVGPSRPKLVDWTTQCPEVCSLAVAKFPKLVGTADKPVQVDESNFSEWRNYGKGRLLVGDKSKSKLKHSETIFADDDTPDGDDGHAFDWNPEVPPPDDE